MEETTNGIAKMSEPDECSELSDITESLATAKDLDCKTQRILELLEGDGRKVLQKDPGILSKMLQKAPALIKSASYVRIIKEMTDVYKTVGCSMKKGLLTYLVDGIKDMKLLYDPRNNQFYPPVFVRHQENLFSLIQVLLSADDSVESRTRCLGILITYASYVAFPYQADSCFQWTNTFFEVLKRLLQEGADPAWKPTWKPVFYMHENASVASHGFFRSIIFILANEDHHTGALMDIYPLFLTEASLNYTDSSYGSLLHALVGVHWRWIDKSPDGLFERYIAIISNVIKANPCLVETTNDDGRTPLHNFLRKIKTSKGLLNRIGNIVPALTSKANVDVQDVDGCVALHYLAELFPLDSSSSASRSNVFLNLINCLKSPSNINIQDKNGHTVLHLLMKKVSFYPNMAHDLLDVFSSLTTPINMNLADNGSATPYTWILQGKTVHENEDQGSFNFFSKIEQMFLRNGADEGLGRKGLNSTKFTWLDEELSDETVSLARLQQLHKLLKAVKCDTTIEQFNEDSCNNIKLVCNPEYVRLIMAIMKILVETEANVQTIWNSFSEEFYAHKFHILEVEILLLCLQKGAQPTQREFLEVFSMKDTIKADEELVLYFKLLASMKDSEGFTIDVEFLKDWYQVHPDVLRFGKKLMQVLFNKPDIHIESVELVKHLLLISLEKCMPFDERTLEHFTMDSWLQRSVLHLAVIFLDNENALNYLPKAILSKCIDLGDLHGCTPLHVAYLHHNKDAVEFLVSHGAKEDITDNFGRTPRSLGKLDGMGPLDGIADTLGLNRGVSLTKENHTDAAHYELCKKVIDSESGVLEQMRPMVVLSEVEAQALCDELKELFKRLVDKTKFSQTVKDIFIAGSLRECLKVGRFDEADVQLRVTSTNLPDRGKSKFYEEMAKDLQESLSKISWDGINLRPVSIKYPWKLIREGGGLYQGVKISVDIVCIKINEIKDSTPLLELREEILEGGPSHQLTKYALLGRLNILRDTTFPFEWDVLDSLPPSSRLAIAVAKALVVAYDWCKGDHLHVEMPISSYMLKTAFFCLLAHNIQLNKTIESLIQTFVLEETETAKRSTCGADSTTDQSEGKNVVNNQWNRPQKLQYNPNPKWITDYDLDQHAEQARVIACRLFRLIKHFARHNYKLASYFRITEDFLKCEFGEAEYIIDICEFLLKRLEENVFFTAH